MRALLVVLDSVGVGQAVDAAAYGDEGADTLGHILERLPSLALPTLRRIGLDAILSGTGTPELPWACGRMQEASAGKDTTTGHWEIAGAILEKPFPTFETFPPELVAAIESETGVRFIGNYPASGTQIIQELGQEHVTSGHPILYTSADSVLQIAAHESVLPLDHLYALCKVARKHADAYQIGRVIARPFTGTEGNFERTSGRHDYSYQPPRTILNALADQGLKVWGVGKISDIFAGSGVTLSLPTHSNAEGMAAISREWPGFSDGLLFVNLVDFDMLFGHRRDVEGYARALEAFDQWLAGFLPTLAPEDLVLITADHGNDPTWHGTDHTREQVPIFAHHRDLRGPLGLRQTYADIAATPATHFQLPAPWLAGISFFTPSETGT